MAAQGQVNTTPTGGTKSDDPAIEFAGCFWHLANLPIFAFDRLSRYEATLWRQGGWILYALETLDRRKPHERRRCSNPLWCARRTGLILFARLTSKQVIVRFRP
jgi:hypothetical protein